MTARLRWTYNGYDLLLQPRRWSEGFSALDRGDWQVLDIHGADHLRGLFGLHPDGCFSLRQLLLGEGRFDLARLSDQQVLDEVAHLLRCGQWQVLRATHSLPASTGKTVEAPPQVVQPSRSTPAPAPTTNTVSTVAVEPDVAGQPEVEAGSTTEAAAVLAAAVVAVAAVAAVSASAAPAPSHWIEIELVGEDDRPIPDEAYEVTLPDQQVVRGNLDADGWARIDNITSAGDCLVSFPRLDKAAWVVHAQSPLDSRRQG